MALKIFSHHPAALLSKIKKAIDDDKVATWSYNANNEFDHATRNWTGLCKFKVTICDGYLLCTANPPAGQKHFANRDVFGVYQGRFSEMLMNHFLGDFVFIASGSWKSVEHLTYKPTAKRKAA